MDQARQDKSPSNAEQTKPKVKQPEKENRKEQDAPGETMEGEASPGLTISGGGGHA